MMTFTRLFAAFTLGLCALSPAFAQSELSPFERRPDLLVATTRMPVGNPVQKPWFSGKRGPGLSFTTAEMVPPDKSLLGKVTSIVGGGLVGDSG